MKMHYNLHFSKNHNYNVMQLMYYNYDYNALAALFFFITLSRMDEVQCGSVDVDIRFLGKLECVSNLVWWMCEENNFGEFVY